MIRPFFILGLPRSRTYWLSKFLTYREWTCGHEELRHLRSFEDVKSWLKQPFTGSAETALASFWRLIPENARIVIVRRPAEEVKESLLRLPGDDGGAFDPKALDGLLKRADAKLDQVSRRGPGAVLQLQFHELSEKWAAKAIFERCLPYQFDEQWWKTIARFNLQTSMPMLMRHYKAFEPQSARFAKIAKQKMLSDLERRERKPLAGVEFAEDPFEEFYTDAQGLFADHLSAVGEAPDAFSRKNLPLLRLLDQAGMLQIVTARSNGRMFGYLMTEISPSRESEHKLSAVHTTHYASPEIPGLGMRLEREAVARLKAKGIGEVFGRSGPRGDGPKMGVLYQRAGFERDGELWRLDLGSA